MKTLWKEIKEWIVSAAIAFFMDTDAGKRYFEEYLGLKNDIRKLFEKDRIRHKRIYEIYEKIASTNRQLLFTREQLHRLDRLYNMAVDIDNPNYSHSGSWAVIVLNGKPEYMRFIRLPKGDMLEIARFLRQFDVGNRPPTLDFPHGIPKDFFYHDLGRNPDGSQNES